MNTAYCMLIVENECEQVEQLKFIVNRLNPLIEIYAALSYEDAISYISENTLTFSFFFLDIDLGEGKEKNGISLGRYLRSMQKYQDTPIVFLTSYSDEIWNAVNQLHCYLYLIKPYQEEMVQHTLLELMEKNRILKILDKEGIWFQVKEDDILFIESYLGGVRIYTIYDVICTNQYSLKQLQKILNSYHIIQCHKRYVIHLQYCHDYDKTLHIIKIYDEEKNKYDIPVGRVYKKQLEERLGISKR